MIERQNNEIVLPSLSFQPPTSAVHCQDGPDVAGLLPQVEQPPQQPPPAQADENLPPVPEDQDEDIDDAPQPSRPPTAFSPHANASPDPDGKMSPVSAEIINVSSG